MQNIIRFLHNRLSHFTLIIAWLWGFYIFRIRNKVKIIGRENLPHDTNILYLSNHQTLIDSWLIGISVVSFREILFFPSRVPWNAPDRGNFFRHWLGKYVIKLLKNIPTVRHMRNHDAILQQLKLFTDVLENSNLVLFFEGTRSRDG